MAILGIQKLEDIFIFIQDKSVITLDKKVIYEHYIQLTSVSAVQKGRIAITDVEKNVILLSFNEESGVWSRLGQWRVPKCATCCAFFNGLCYVSDKFGQVFVYPRHAELTSHVHLSDDSESEDESDTSPQQVQSLFTPLPLLGHVSMLTKLLVTDKFIITADRDEKIRITDRLRPYLIHAFLLNHTSYISDLSIDNNNKDILVSADGAGRICWWNLNNFSLIRSQEMNFPIRQLYHLDDSLVIVEDDSSRVHILHQQNEFKAVFDLPQKVHFACSNLISTLNTLYKIDLAFGTKTVLISSTDSSLYEPKGRIAKRPFQ